jgi:signal transduction histidine kinase
MVYADIGMMEKVIQNLLDNAIKFTAEHGNILIKLSPELDSVLIEIHDTGQGISKDELPHIFDRYQRNQRSGQRDNEGLGLGLAIVKRIMEVHDLRIDVNSVQNKGTVFSFRIPIFKSSPKITKEVEYS